MKKSVTIIIVCCFICVCVTYIFDQYYPHKYAVAKGTHATTVKEVHNKLTDYMDKKGLKIRVGSPEFAEYLSDLLLLEKDGDLKKIPEYEDIKVYASNYLANYNPISVEPGKVNIENFIRKTFSLYDIIPDKIENKTINDLIKEETNNTRNV